MPKREAKRKDVMGIQGPSQSVPTQLFQVHLPLLLSAPPLRAGVSPFPTPIPPYRIPVALFTSSCFPRCI